MMAPGRPWASHRSVLNGILWVLRTGAPWADLPEAYPSFQTCHPFIAANLFLGVPIAACRNSPSIETLYSALSVK
jgi:transposase